MSLLVRNRRPDSAMRRRNERGATMVEFGLFFLLFLVVAVALMELGRGVWTFTTVAHAARAGARYAITHGQLNPISNGDPSIADVVHSNAIGLNTADMTVNTKYEEYDDISGTWLTGPTYNKRNNVVEVKVGYPFRLVVGPLLPVPGTLQLSSTSRMIIAN